MPRYIATIPSAWPADRAFAYMADFSNAREWDPSVVSASRGDDGPVRPGSSFDLRVRAGKRVMDFRYEITRMDERTVVLRAMTPRFESIDTITVREDGARSEVRYDAYLTGRGAMRFANPLIGRTFHRMGAAAHERLRGVLSTP